MPSGWSGELGFLWGADGGADWRAATPGTGSDESPAVGGGGRGRG